jgi:hypothetical protein
MCPLWLPGFWSIVWLDETLRKSVISTVTADDTSGIFAAQQISRM